MLYLGQAQMFGRYPILGMEHPLAFRSPALCCFPTRLLQVVDSSLAAGSMTATLREYLSADDGSFYL